MSEYHATKHNLVEVFDGIQGDLEKEPVLIITTQGAGTGNWGAAKLWRVWMESTAKFMAANGCVMPLVLNADGTYKRTRPFNSSDSHEYFTRRWLGVDEEGTRLSWRKGGKGEGRPATQGERYNALRSHEEWATEKGINLFKPRNSEYEQLEREQQQ